MYIHVRTGLDLPLQNVIHTSAEAEQHYDRSVVLDGSAQVMRNFPRCQRRTYTFEMWLPMALTLAA
jgi:hypothetical protein